MPEEPPLLVVDGANVVGSVPDGWWRDRRGAAQRLRDGLAKWASRGLPHRSAPAALRDGQLDIVLVVEGRARGIESVAGVRVVTAPASGDDAIVDVVAQRGDRRCFVATADRALVARVRGLGAEVIGPRMVHPGRADRRRSREG